MPYGVVTKVIKSKSSLHRREALPIHPAATKRAVYVFKRPRTVCLRPYTIPRIHCDLDKVGIGRRDRKGPLSLIAATRYGTFDTPVTVIYTSSLDKAVHSPV